MTLEYTLPIPIYSCIIEHGVHTSRVCGPGHRRHRATKHVAAQAKPPAFFRKDPSVDPGQNRWMERKPGKYYAETESGTFSVNADLWDEWKAIAVKSKMSLSHIFREGVDAYIAAGCPQINKPERPRAAIRSLNARESDWDKIEAARLPIGLSRSKFIRSAIYFFITTKGLDQ